jgi:peptidyl-prolyl cis-trans isomerase D
MLEFFRQHIGGGLVGVVLVGLLAVAFAFSFGAQSKGWGSGGSEQMAAVADGFDIPINTLEYAYNLLGGQGAGSDDTEGVAVRLSALEGLVERDLLVGLAKDTGITASTEEAVDSIVNSEIYLTRPVGALMERMEAYPFFNPADASKMLVSLGHRIPRSFKDDEGKFNLEFYKSFVQHHLRQSEEDFVEQQRLEIIANRMRELIVSPVRISDEEVRQEYERENDTATVRYIRLIPAHFADKLDPSPAEISAWAASHKDEVKQYYETNEFRYTNLEEQVRARHILKKVDKEAPDEEKAKVKAEMEELLTRIKAGESFKDLAKAFSEDTGSAAKGGDLGYTPRGRMVPEFEKAMFALKPGEISDIVETKYGYHIIEVEGKRQGNVSLEDATPEIAEKLYREAKGKEAAKAEADALLARLKNGEKMADLLPKDDKNEGPLSVKMSTSREFERSARSIPGIGEAPSIVEAAFDDHPEPGVYDVRGDYYVAELDTRNKPNDEEFKKLRDSLREKLLSMKQAYWLVSEIKEMRERAEKEGRIKILYEPQKSSENAEDENPNEGSKKLDKTQKPAAKPAETTSPKPSKESTPTPTPEESEPSPDQEDEGE